MKTLFLRGGRWKGSHAASMEDQKTLRGAQCLSSVLKGSHAASRTIEELKTLFQRRLMFVRSLKRQWWCCCCAPYSSLSLWWCSLWMISWSCMPSMQRDFLSRGNWCLSEATPWGCNMFMLPTRCVLALCNMLGLRLHRLSFRYVWLNYSMVEGLLWHESFKRL